MDCPFKAKKLFSIKFWVEGDDNGSFLSENLLFCPVYLKITQVLVPFKGYLEKVFMIRWFQGTNKEVFCFIYFLDIFAGVVPLIKNQGYFFTLLGKDPVPSCKLLCNIGKKFSIVGFPFIKKMNKRDTKILCDKKGKVDLAKIVPFCLVFSMLWQFGSLIFLSNVGKKVSGIGYIKI